MARNLFDLGNYGFGGGGGSATGYPWTRAAGQGDPWTDNLSGGRNSGGMSFPSPRQPRVPAPGPRGGYPRMWSGRIQPYPGIPPTGGGAPGGSPGSEPGGGGSPGPDLPQYPAPMPFPSPGPRPRPAPQGPIPPMQIPPSTAPGGGFPGSPGGDTIPPRPTPLPMPPTQIPPSSENPNRMEPPPNLGAMIQGLLAMMAGQQANGGNNPVMQLLSQYGQPVDFQQVLMQALGQMPETWLPQLRAHFYNTPFYQQF